MGSSPSQLPNIQRKYMVSDRISFMYDIDPIVNQSKEAYQTSTGY